MIAISGNILLPVFCQITTGGVGWHDTTRGFKIDSPASANLKKPSSR